MQSLKSQSTMMMEQRHLDLLFTPQTIKKILNIHLSMQHQEYELVCAPSLDGLFSVKTAYHVGQSERFPSS